MAILAWFGMVRQGMLGQRAEEGTLVVLDMDMV